MTRKQKIRRFVLKSRERIATLLWLLALPFMIVVGLVFVFGVLAFSKDARTDYVA